MKHSTHIRHNEHIRSVGVNTSYGVIASFQSLKKCYIVSFIYQKLFHTLDFDSMELFTNLLIE